MSEQTLNELTNLFKNLTKENDNTNCLKQSNLSFDDAYNHFFYQYERQRVG